MDRIIERWRPTGIAFVVAVIYGVFLAGRGIPPAFPEVLSAVITVGAIAIGFLATTKAILVSISKGRMAAYMREAGTWGLVVDYLLFGILWAAASVGFSVTLLLIAPGSRCLSNTPGLDEVLCCATPWLMTGWVFSGAGMVVAVHRIASIFATILRSDFDG